MCRGEYDAGTSQLGGSAAASDVTTAAAARRTADSALS